MKRSSPPYQSRAMQIATHLKARIAAGEWQERLPGERILARELGVGRMTLREALDELQEEGVLSKHGPAGTRLCQSAPAPRPHAKKVGMLLGGPLDTLHNNASLMVDELRRIFYGKNIALHLHDARSSSKRGIFPYFRHLIDTVPYDGWVVCGGTREMQAWCAGLRLPLVLASARFAGVELPSVEIHFRAVCRHAVGEMVRRGHRRLALILPRTPANSGPGDIESRLGFQEAIETFADTGVSGRLELFSGSKASLCKLADTLLARPQCPSAWLVPTPFFLPVMVHLLARGVRIPGEISLVCRDAETYHQSLQPEPSRYVTDMRIKARQISTLMQRLLAHPHGVREDRLVMPEFVTGETLGAPSS